MNKIKYTILFFITCSINLICFANNEIKTASFPIPIRVDNDIIRSSLFIKCRFKKYEIPFKDFELMKLDYHEKSFVKLVNAIKQNDLISCLEVCSGYTQRSKNEIKQFMNAYHKSFVPIWDKIHVYYQFYIGNDRLFIWGVENAEPIKSGPLRRSFYFEKDRVGKFVWTASIPNTIDTLLTDIVQKNAGFPGKYALIKNESFDYQYIIPGSTDEHPIYLQFNGKPYNVEVFTNQFEPSNEIINFYQKAYHVFKNMTAEDFAEFYTPVSRQKYREWATKMGKDSYNIHRQQTINAGRKVVFILNANPVYIVFHHRLDNEYIRYQYIVRNSDNQKLKLTSFFFEGYLDDYLKNQELFVEPILRKIIYPKTNINNNVENDVNQENKNVDIKRKTGETLPMKKILINSLWLIILMFLLVIFIKNKNQRNNANKYNSKI